MGLTPYNTNHYFMETSVIDVAFSLQNRSRRVTHSPSLG